MEHAKTQALKAIRNDIRDTLKASVRQPTVVTDHEQLEDISLQLARTLNNIEHQIDEIDKHDAP